MPSYDYVLVGGGLQNALIALAVHFHQPEARIALIERAGRLGGNHTWCVHEADVPSDARSWFEPLVTFRWPRYRVSFPKYERTIDEAYVGVSSGRLNGAITELLGKHTASRLYLGADAVEIGANRVSLSNGHEIRGTSIVDSRGLHDTDIRNSCGYQKFLGMELELEEPHGLSVPTLMDARMDQTDGYRFMYVLPLSERTILLEDTYFHESSDLPRTDARDAILAYAAERGWTVREMVREESGILPMPWEGSAPEVQGSPLVAGYRGRWFHPGTGYSLPIAIRLAAVVGRNPPEESSGSDARGLATEVASAARFARFLNRLMFRWYPPPARRAIFERFYRLPDDTIRRFYGLRIGRRDRLRLLVGRPPRGLSLRHRLQNGGAR